MSEPVAPKARKAFPRGELRIVSPSGAVPQPQRVQRAAQHLGELGFRVRIDSAALLREQRFAGSDARRVQALHRAARSRASVVMATRGGYGLTRVLDALDYALLHEAVSRRGQVWVGHSDFTALQLAMLARAGTVSYSGPMASFDFGAERVDEITQESFLDVVDARLEAVGFECPDAPRSLDASGVLWGGNLSLVCNLVGTPYLPRARGVLFLEDVSEHPYRVERMLTQLLGAGVLQRQRAVLLGAFTDYRLSEHDAGYDLPDVVAWLRSRLREYKVPVLSGLPFGHVRTKLCLPHGARCRLLRDGTDAYLVFGHSHGGHHLAPGAHAHGSGHDPHDPH
ncbi:MAG: LD-carboxypeptidase [Betaproteobacteria bacterium]|nr:LD-carboxypeptidase [Betaproteobacteria bacterium]